MASELSTTSIAVYNRMLDALKKKIGKEDFLLDHEGTINWIETSQYSHNTKKTYYITLVSTLKSRQDEGAVKALEFYRAKMNDYNAKQQQIYETQEMSEKEKEKYLTWGEIAKVRNELEHEADDLFSFQEYLIVCLYTLMPPIRLDYAFMKVVHSMPTETSGNYLVVLPKQMKIVLNNYKTAKKYGTIILDIPKKLEVVVHKWLNMFLETPEYLLYNHKGEPMSESLLSSTIRNTFYKKTKKAASVNTLRHSFVSQHRKGEKSLNEIKKVASQMCHSATMNALYRRL